MSSVLGLDSKICQAVVNKDASTSLIITWLMITYFTKADNHLLHQAKQNYKALVHEVLINLWNSCYPCLPFNHLEDHPSVVNNRG